MQYRFYKLLLSSLCCLFLFGTMQATCIADIEIEVTDDLVIVTNTSPWSFDEYEWTFEGIQVPSSPESVLMPHPGEEGVYEMCLYIADTNWGCSDMICKAFYIGPASELCNYTDCVWPGDANGDAKSNVYDLLNIGYGFWAEGPSRDGSAEEWVGQLGTDWEESTVTGVNFKHLDANGDGLIDYLDAELIVENYSPVLTASGINTTGPKLHIDYDAESVVFDDNSPDAVEITATINLDDLQGVEIQSLAFTLNFPFDLVLPHSVEINTDDAATVFGTGNTGNIEVHRDLSVNGLGRYDFAISSINGLNIPDLSTIATTKFIVIGDIIQGRTETEIDVPALIHSVRAMTTDGEEITIGENEAPSIFTIIDETTVSTNQPDVSSSVSIYPNPVQDELVLDMNELTAESVAIYNATGQLIQTSAINSRYQTVNLTNVAKGIYIAKIQTVEGLAVKRFVKE